MKESVRQAETWLSCCAQRASHPQCIPGVKPCRSPALRSSAVTRDRGILRKFAGGTKLGRVVDASGGCAALWVSISCSKKENENPTPGEEHAPVQAGDTPPAKQKLLGVLVEHEPATRLCCRGGQQPLGCIRVGVVHRSKDEVAPLYSVVAKAHLEHTVQFRAP